MIGLFNYEEQWFLWEVWGRTSNRRKKKLAYSFVAVIGPIDYEELWFLWRVQDSS
jgi:hypothetical protein